MKKYLFLIVVIVLTGFTSGTQTESKEYDLKAAFIYNFTKYIEWNTDIGSAEFIIGIVDSSPIVKPLSDIANSKMVGNKKIVVQQFKTLEEITSCQILFISGNTRLVLKDILKKATSKGTLIISEKAEYAKQGTAINFIVVADKLKFEANTTVINSAGLTASSQLLKLAIIVE